MKIDNIDFGSLLNISTATPPKDEKVAKKRPNGAAYNKAAIAVLDKAATRSLALQNTSKAKTEAFRNFEDAVGGRVELSEVLKHCPPDSPAYKPLQKLFEDTDFNSTRDVTLSLICSRHKVNLAQLMAAFRDATAAKMLTETVARLTAHVPDVVDAVAQDSKNGYSVCTICDGDVRIPRIGPDGEFLIIEEELQTQLCHGCRGRGKVYEKGDIGNRKVFFELTGILKPKGLPEKGVTVQIANMGSFQPGDGSYENLLKTVDRVAIPEKSIDVDVVDIPYTYYENVEDTPVTPHESADEDAGN